MKTLKVLTLITAFALALCHNAFAGAQTQLAGGTNNVAAAGTNNYNLYGQTVTSGYITPATGLFLDGTKSTDMYLQVTATYINTTTNTGQTTTFRFSGSVDLAYWTNNAVTMSFTNAATATNTITVLTKVSGVLPQLGLYSIENPGAATLTNVFVKAFTKNGI